MSCHDDEHQARVIGLVPQFHVGLDDIDHGEDARAPCQDHQDHHRLEHAGEIRVEAEEENAKEDRNNDRKADKPYRMFAQRSGVDIQNAEQAVEDNGEDDGESNKYNGVARMVTLEGLFHIAWKTQSGCITRKILRYVLTGL